jgi:hypothetical protein
MAMSRFIQVALRIALSMIAAASTVAISRAQPAGMDPEQPIGRQSPASNPDTMAGGVPVMYFGVNSCGTKVFWLVMEDGRMFRLDTDHHPKDMEGLMHSIESLPHDLVEIPCAAHL